MTMYAATALMVLSDKGTVKDFALPRSRKVISRRLK
jgi:hypothetical protein